MQICFPGLVVIKRQLQTISYHAVGWIVLYTMPKKVFFHKYVVIDIHHCNENLYDKIIVVRIDGDDKKQGKE